MPHYIYNVFLYRMNVYFIIKSTYERPEKYVSNKNNTRKINKNNL